MLEPLYDDPVVAEIHALRAKMLAECGGDHRKLMAQVRAREEKFSQRVIAVPLPPRPAAVESSGAVDNVAQGNAPSAAR